MRRSIGGLDFENQGRKTFHIASSCEQRGLDSNGPALAALQQNALELSGFLPSTSQRRGRKDSDGVGDQLLLYAQENSEMKYTVSLYSWCGVKQD